MHIPSHSEVGRFIYLFNLFTQKVYNGGRFKEFPYPNAEGKIGKWAYAHDGSWLYSPALMVDYRNEHEPFGSQAFSAFGYDFYLFAGLNLSEAKETKQSGTFTVKNDAKYLAQAVADAWTKLGGKAKLQKDFDALICVGKGDVWVSLYA
jgi:hypothetical protein